MNWRREEMSVTKDQADFATIRQRVTMGMALDHYQITSLKKQKGDELRGPCPIHSGKPEERAFQVNTAKNIWHCFYCKAGGNVIDYVAKMEGCSIREAGLRIWQWFNLDSGTSSPSPNVPLDNHSGHHPQAAAPRGELGSQLAEILDTLKNIYAELQQIRLQNEPRNRV
jgi:DNA primase